MILGSYGSFFCILICGTRIYNGIVKRYQGMNYTIFLFYYFNNKLFFCQLQLYYIWITFITNIILIILESAFSSIFLFHLWIIFIKFYRFRKEAKRRESFSFLACTDIILEQNIKINSFAVISYYFPNVIITFFYWFCKSFFFYTLIIAP